MASPEELSPFHFQPSTKLSCVRSIRFKVNSMDSGKLQGPWDVLKHSYKPSYFYIQRDIQESLVGIGNCFAAQARDWKANQNAQR